MTDTELCFFASTPKSHVLEIVKSYLENLGFSITLRNEEKPWGAYYYVDEKDKAKFADMYFKDRDLTEILTSGLKLTPKILVVAPNEILSWQWHERRGELWNLIQGDAEYKESSTDEEPNDIKNLSIGQTIELPQGTRHRLIGSTKADGKWGIVAEIWEHSDINNPSTEEDNHRLKDKYSRT